jgi:hypothetical protein
MLETQPINTLQIQIRRRDNPEPLAVTVLAQKTGTPGLYVTPELGHGGMTGYWQVTHGPSGAIVPTGEWGGMDFDTARRIADALADAPVDWTADLDVLAPQLKQAEVRDAVTAAVRRGKYPPADVDGDEAAQRISGPAGYPRTAAQATAEQMARYHTGSGLHLHHEWWSSSGRSGDEQEKRVRELQLLALLADYGIVHLLRAFAAVDQQAADFAARQLWEAYEAGDSVGEWLYEWGREYGIPAPDADAEVSR